MHWVKIELPRFIESNRKDIPINNNRSATFKTKQSIFTAYYTGFIIIKPVFNDEPIINLSFLSQCKNYLKS